MQDLFDFNIRILSEFPSRTVIPHWNTPFTWCQTHRFRGEPFFPVNQTSQWIHHTVSCIPVIILMVWGQQWIKRGQVTSTLSLYWSKCMLGSVNLQTSQSITRSESKSKEGITALLGSSIKTLSWFIQVICWLLGLLLGSKDYWSFNTLNLNWNFNLASSS